MLNLHRICWPLVGTLLLAVLKTTCAQVTPVGAGMTGTPDETRRHADDDEKPRGEKSSGDFDWSAVPTDVLSTPGAKIVNLTSCPSGVKGNEPEYWIYIHGSGTPEAVKVTGGTCTGNGDPGTLQFTTMNAHPAGYTIGSASSGLQEASIAARRQPPNIKGRPGSGRVIVSPGVELHLRARVSIRASYQTIDFSGATFNCYMTDICIFVGDPSKSILFQNITLIAPVGRSMVPGNTKPMIEVNAQKTKISNASARHSENGGTFGSYVQIDDDQAFLLDGLDTSGHSLRCDASFCGPAVYAPGPFNTFSAVGWLKNMNISNSCNGNGVKWLSGNTLRISDSVIQGYAQYGVSAGGRGGFGTLTLDNIYQEVGNCTNPFGKIGEAGVISRGENINMPDVWQGHQPAPVGKEPVFARTGSIDYRYYVVVKDSGMGASVPFYAGKALSSGLGNIDVSWPCVISNNHITYDLLRISSTGTIAPAPFGTGNFAVATNIAQAAGVPVTNPTNEIYVCGAKDTQGSLSPYTVASPTFFPELDFWQAAVVLSAGTNQSRAVGSAQLNINEFAGATISVAGQIKPTVFAQKCYPWNYFSPVWAACVSWDSVGNNFSRNGATLLQTGGFSGGATAGLKGRTILELSGGNGLSVAATDLYTLGDSNAQKTLSTPTFRTSWDANDTAIGLDQTSSQPPSNFQMAFRSPLSISNYIGRVFDGKGWLERLTAKEKTFAVPVIIENGNTLTLGEGSALSRMKIFTAKDIATVPVPAQGCLDVAGKAAGLMALDIISGVTPPASLGNLSLNAHASGKDTVTFHFCNASKATAAVPAGSYSFLAVH